MSEETIFTKIIKGEIPSKQVYHDDLVTAFEDINPKAKHHILIVTNKPIPTVSDVEPEDEQGGMTSFELLGRVMPEAR